MQLDESHAITCSVYLLGINVRLTNIVDKIAPLKVKNNIVIVKSVAYNNTCDTKYNEKHNQRERKEIIMLVFFLFFFCYI